MGVESIKKALLAERRGFFHICTNNKPYVVKCLLIRVVMVGADATHVKTFYMH